MSGFPTTNIQDLIARALAMIAGARLIFGNAIPLHSLRRPSGWSGRE
jgi:hypothetical protein